MSTLNSLEHLVLAGDEANLAERVVELITAPRRRRGGGRLRRVALSRPPRYLDPPTMPI